MTWNDGELARPWQGALDPDGFHTGVVSTTYICLRIIPNKDTLRSAHFQSFCGKGENLVCTACTALVGKAQLMRPGQEVFRLGRTGWLVSTASR